MLFITVCHYAKLKGGYHSCFIRRVYKSITVQIITTPDVEFSSFLCNVINVTSLFDTSFTIKAQFYLTSFNGCQKIEGKQIENRTK